MTRYLAIHFPAEWRIINIFPRAVLILRKLTARLIGKNQVKKLALDTRRKNPALRRRACRRAGGAVFSRRIAGPPGLVFLWQGRLCPCLAVVGRGAGDHLVARLL